MKLKSFFLLIISLATVSSLVDIHSASAECIGRGCGTVFTRGGYIRRYGVLPAELQRVADLSSQGKFAEATGVATQFLEEAEGAQDLDGQAAAHQALADIDARMGELDSASSHLRDAETLYQRSENSQGSNEVQLQLQQLQLQQLQPQQLQPQQLQLQQ